MPIPLFIYRAEKFHKIRFSESTSCALDSNTGLERPISEFLPDLVTFARSIRSFGISVEPVADRKDQPQTSVSPRLPQDGIVGVVPAYRFLFQFGRKDIVHVEDIYSLSLQNDLVIPAAKAQ